MVEDRRLGKLVVATGRNLIGRDCSWIVTHSENSFPLDIATLRPPHPESGRNTGRLLIMANYQALLAPPSIS